jgi:peptide deformylase
MKTIDVYPHPSLRVKQKPIVSWDKSTRETVSGLKKAVVSYGDGIGLASPQIAKKGRVFVIKANILSFPQTKTGALAFINPKIKKTFAEKVYPAMEDDHGHREEFLEGCLSVPAIYGPVKRWLKITVSWQEPGNLGKLIDKSAELSGMEAIVFQHELDHLDGVLFIDHVKNEKKGLFKFDENGRKIKADWQELENL